MRQFDHEKLRVYASSLKFVKWSTRLLSETTSRAAVKDQLDRASTSIPLNIAEGNAKWSVADRRKFLRIASGSATECSACLDVFVSKGLASAERTAEGRELLLDIVSMLVGMMNSLDGRLAEDAPEYGKNEHENE